VPVVTTALGCQGINAKHEEHLWIEDSEKGFAERVLDTLKETPNDMLKRAYAHVSNFYGWESIVRKTEQYFEKKIREKKLIK